MAGSATKKKSCFVVAPIGKPESDTRKRSDQILKYVIAPAAATAGLSVKRADELPEPGLITSQVIQHVVGDDVVIADLTEHNPNVFYELAIRHAVRKPFVQLIEIGENIPFDVGGVRTVFVNHHDLDSVERCKDELAQHLEVIARAKEPVETPISVAIDLQALRSSENPVEKSNAEILEALAEIRRDVRGIRVASYSAALNSDFREVRRTLIELTRSGEIPNSVLTEFITPRTSRGFDRWIRTLGGDDENTYRDVVSDDE